MASLKFTTIAHATHRYLSPLSTQKAAWLVERMAIVPGSRILDVGCGRAGLMIDALAASDARGVGVDINREFIEAAANLAHERGVADRIEWRCAPLNEAVLTSERFDVVLCLGSSQAVGKLADAMHWAFGVLRDGGVALFGDGYWKRDPDAAYLDTLGATAAELLSHAGNARLARLAGFRVLATSTANDDEWDDYEGRYCAAIERWTMANADDPDALAFASRIRAWHDAYLNHGRDTLGFGYYVLAKA